MGVGETGWGLSCIGLFLGCEGALRHGRYCSGDIYIYIYFISMHTIILWTEIDKELKLHCKTVSSRYESR